MSSEKNTGWLVNQLIIGAASAPNGLPFLIHMHLILNPLSQCNLEYLSLTFEGSSQFILQ